MEGYVGFVRSFLGFDFDISCPMRQPDAAEPRAALLLLLLLLLLNQYLD